MNLHQVDGDGAGRRYPLRGELTAGSASSNGIALPNDRAVSRLHGRVFTKGCEYFVEDFDSTNGTFVNGVRVSGVAPIRLGSRITFGKTAFVLESDEVLGAATEIVGNATEIFATVAGSQLASRGGRHSAPQDDFAKATVVAATVLGYLEFDESGGPRRVPLFAGNRVVVGRNRQADVPLDEPEMSRQHFAIRAGGGRVVIEDLGSANGTSVNGAAIAGEHVASDGDVITVGRTRLVIILGAGQRVSRQRRRRLGAVSVVLGVAAAIAALGLLAAVAMTDEADSAPASASPLPDPDGSSTRGQVAPPPAAPRPVEFEAPLAPQQSYAVVAPSAGKIKSLAVKPGDLVAAGDLLAVLASSPAESEVAAAEAEYRDLAEKAAKSPDYADFAGAAKARLDAILRQFKTRKLLAERAGTVIAVSVENKQPVASGGTLMVIADVTRLVATVPSALVGQLPERARCAVEVPTSTASTCELVRGQEGATLVVTSAAGASALGLRARFRLSADGAQ